MNYSSGRENRISWRGWTPFRTRRKRVQRQQGEVQIEEKNYVAGRKPHIPEILDNLSPCHTIRGFSDEDTKTPFFHRFRSTRNIRADNTASRQISGPLHDVVPIHYLNLARNRLPMAPLRFRATPNRGSGACTKTHALANWEKRALVLNLRTFPNRAFRNL